MKDFKEITGMIALWVLVVFGLGALIGVVVMWLWNQVMPEVFGLKELTLWQALCISWLCSMLFKPTTGASSKSADAIAQLEKQLHFDLVRMEAVLEQLRDVQHTQESHLDESKGYLADISGNLERQR